MKRLLIHCNIGIVITTILALGLLGGCATSINQIHEWEQSNNISKLSEVARNKRESPQIRKKSLESLARLNWKPTNEERLNVYGLFASKNNYQEAVALMQAINSDQFAEIDKKIVDIASLLDNSGKWNDSSKAHKMYNELLTLEKKAVIISLCQQIVARPILQTRIVLLAIKLGIKGSEDELIGVLFEYGNVPMAEDYLNSGSSILAEGARRWARANGYSVSSGFGSSRSGWGKF